MSVDTRSTDLDLAPPRGRLTRPAGVIALAAVGVLSCNLLLYGIGRACGGTFVYTHDGKAVTVDPASVAIMSVVPLTLGLALAAWLSRRRPVPITVAAIVVAVLAVATIGLMTIPAGFDTASALSLAAMHLTLVPVAVLALRALDPRRGEPVV